ncbi:hypothetical protein EDC56_3596 [Sinobacterium caligoides]|uniref:Lipoprotein n=1 Tax=Sinobacterium caligoides TaxID=933926 RepID=A0A3N2DDX1_9GAMM|nr:hypothetical protein [Sinobacterium caligoides]ROR97927.1 hypothetical protein EDC56_3596 [Sinobacterium caligoides]
MRTQVLFSVIFSLLLAGCLPSQQHALTATPESRTLTMQGVIQGYGYDDYPLTLVAGEQLYIHLDSAALDVIVVQPIEQRLSNQQPLSIDASGDYLLRVLLPRARARRDEQQVYRLRINITPARR